MVIRRQFELTDIALIISGHEFGPRIISVIRLFWVFPKQNLYQKRIFSILLIAENLSLTLPGSHAQIVCHRRYCHECLCHRQDPQHAVICATTGLVSQLNHSELG
jgi:hypothetical protein